MDAAMFVTVHLLAQVQKNYRIYHDSRAYTCGNGAHTISQQGIRSMKEKFHLGSRIEKVMAAAVTSNGVVLSWATKSDENLKIQLVFVQQINYWLDWSNVPPSLSLSHMDFTHNQKCSLFMCQKHYQTMSYSTPLLPQWEVPGPTSPHTISPRPCPTPTIVPHSTHTHSQWATPEPGVPLCNSITQRHTPVLIPSEREKNDGDGRRENCNPRGGTEENGRNTKAGVQRECVWGRVDNTLGRERLTVGQLRLCFCKSLSPELNQSLAKPLRCNCLKCSWDYRCIHHPLAD